MRVDESPELSSAAEQRPGYVPWTLGDVAMGIGLVIGVAIVVTVGMVIGTIVLVGPALLDSDLSGGIEGLLGILAAEGLLQTWLFLLMVAMMAGEGAMLFSAWLFGAPPGASPAAASSSSRRTRCRRSAGGGASNGTCRTPCRTPCSAFARCHGAIRERGRRGHSR